MKAILGRSQAVLLGLILILSSCVGGSGNHSVGGVYLTHSELAREFVRRLNLDAGYDVELVKTYTEQYNYIVVYDYDARAYDAYDLTYYNPGENIFRFLDRNEDLFFYDLAPIGGNLYEDPWSGIIFEETAASPKDLEKMGALVEGLKIKKASEKLQAEFGLSEERSFQVAKLAEQWSKISKSRSMTDADANAFSKDVLGFSLSEAQKAMKKSLNGESEDMNQLIDLAAEKNEISPEKVKHIMKNFFNE